MIEKKYKCTNMYMYNQFYNTTNITCLNTRGFDALACLIFNRYYFKNYELLQ